MEVWPERMDWTRNQLAQVQLHARPESSETEQFAVQELGAYLHRLAGRPQLVPLPLEADHPEIVLGAPSQARLSPCPQQGFAIEITEDTVTLHGHTAADLLHVVYAFLEQLGCRWSVRGRSEEFVPSTTERFSLRSQTWGASGIRFGFCSDLISWHYTQPALYEERIGEDRELVDWMAKVGASTLFFIRHPFDSQNTIPELVLECGRRGISVEHGGHIVPLLLPRELFSEHPEYFPVGPAGERTGLGNVCASQAGALDTIARNAVAWVRELPKSRFFHVWGADLWKGGWCHCPGCSPLSPQDQSLRVCNAVAVALSRAGYNVPVCYLAYHDTIDAELRETPAENVWCEFAPRERCYAHSIGDPECTRNQRYWRAVQGYVQQFRGRVRVFEYYGDAILFFGCAAPISQTIEADLRQYRSLGIDDVLMLQFGSYSRWAYATNFLAFTRGIHAGSRSNDRPRPDWPEADAELIEGLFRLEPLICPLLCYGDVRLAPRDPELAATVVHLVSRTLPLLGAIADDLEARGTASSTALARLARYTQTVFAGVEHEIRTGSRVHSIYAAALETLRAVDHRWKGVWGEVDLPTIHSLYEGALLTLPNE